MGRSNGYRPNKEQRDEVLQWRYVLSTITIDDWVLAGFIMGRITSLLGYTGGPMGGKIEPRACRFCSYYGHTRQWCKKRIALKEEREAREIQAMLDEDREYASQFEEPVQREPYDATKSNQACTFDQLGIPYSVSPYCGPIVGARGGPHAGKWTYDDCGEVVERVV